MAILRKRGDKQSYLVRDELCIGMPCLNAHRIAIRGATSSGSRSTGRFTYECGTRHYGGCPRPRPEFDKALARDRRAEGMRIKG